MATIQHRRASKAQWAADNPVLAPGELGLEIGVGSGQDRFKIGNGLSEWKNLKYFINETDINIDVGRLSEENLDVTYAPYSLVEFVESLETLTLSGRLSKNNLDLSYVPKWMPSTSYAAGKPVVLPNGRLVVRRETGTSNATFDAAEEADWLFTGGGMTKSEADGYYPALGAYTKAASDNREGILNWLQESLTGALVNLTAGPNSGLNNALLRLNTARGFATGLSVSHKNSGRGIDLEVQPGSGAGLQITGRSSTGNPLRTILKSGAAPVLIRTEAGAAFSDGVTVFDSATFKSNTAQFTLADEGRTITQVGSRSSLDPMGTIPAGTTIRTFVSATEVVLSNNSTAAATGVLFEIGGRAVPDSQSLLVVQDENSTTLTTISKRMVNARGVDPTVAALRVHRKVDQSGPILEVRDEALNLMSHIDKNGRFVTNVKMAVAAADLANSSMGLYIDDTPGNQRLLVAGKDSAGGFSVGAVPVGRDRTKRRISLAVGKYYGLHSVPVTTMKAGQSRLRVHEFWVDETTTFDRIGSQVTTSDTGSALRWVIYRDSSGVPGQLILDTGLVATVPSTSTGWKESVISQVLTPDRYWVGCIPQGGDPSLRGTASTTGTESAGMTADEIVSQAGSSVGFTTPSITAAAPTTFPADSPASVLAPLVWLRKAA